MPIRTKRVYEAASAEDGKRFLVDRLWPRGVAKDWVHIEAWLPELGPSHTLRRWFAHDPEKWAGFKKRYSAELADRSELWVPILAASRSGTVTLVYSARQRLQPGGRACRLPSKKRAKDAPQVIRGERPTHLNFLKLFALPLVCRDMRGLAEMEIDAVPELPEQWLVAHRDGDSEAFAKLVQRYRRPVFGYLVHGGVPESDRDDLFQEIFIKIHQRADQYDAARPLHPWLFTVVANTVRSISPRKTCEASSFGSRQQRM